MPAPCSRASSQWSFCAKQIGPPSPCSLFHYRDKQQRETDVILERHGGEVVGIEVKASATPTGADFAGLRYLRDKLGARFKAGALIYTGADTLPFGDRLAAVPLSGLWH